MMRILRFAGGQLEVVGWVGDFLVGFRRYEMGWVWCSDDGAAGRWMDGWCDVAFLFFSTYWHLAGGTAYTSPWQNLRWTWR